MSEKDKQASGGKEGSAIVMVEQTASHVKPYRPTEIQQDSEVHHMRSKAPAAPFAEELRNLAKEAIVSRVESMELKENDRATSSEHKHHKMNKKSSKRRDSAPDNPALQCVESTKDNAGAKTMRVIPSPTQPIPPQIQEEKSELSLESKENVKETREEDSIMEEITELQTPDEAKKHSEWSDEEEAGGLPRSESRASRVSRAVRQLFCCGVRYEAASEDNISTRSGYNHGI